MKRTAFLPVMVIHLDRTLPCLWSQMKEVSKVTVRYHYHAPWDRKDR